LNNNTSENSTKTSNPPNISFSNINGHTTFTYNTGDNNEITNTISGGINLSKIDPIYQDAINKFTDKLDNIIKNENIPKQKVDTIRTNVSNLTKDVENIKPNEEVKDPAKKESIIKNLKDLASNIVALSPQIAETVASMTPLAPFSKSIGKATNYLSQLIQDRLSEP
jgi:hypothetical protein